MWHMLFALCSTLLWLMGPAFACPFVCSDSSNNKVLSAVDRASVDSQFEVFAL